MKVVKNGAIILVVAFAAIVLFLRFVAGRSREQYSLSQDLSDAKRHIRAIDAAERDCYGGTSHFVTRDEEAANCRSALVAITATEKDGFAVAINSDPLQYSITLVPSDRGRLVSLYMERSGRLHFGTRQQPASQSTAEVR